MANFMTKWFITQEVYSVMHTNMCTNTYHTTSKFDGMGYNIKNWLSQEQIMTFPRHKKNS